MSYADIERRLTWQLRTLSGAPSGLRVASPATATRRPVECLDRKEPPMDIVQKVLADIRAERRLLERAEEALRASQSKRRRPKSSVARRRRVPEDPGPVVS